MPRPTIRLRPCHARRGESTAGCLDLYACYEPAPALAPKPKPKPKPKPEPKPKPKPKPKPVSLRLSPLTPTPTPTLTQFIQVSRILGNRENLEVLEDRAGTHSTHAHLLYTCIVGG